MPRKKTTVIEKIQRRTPQGKLISESISKKVYFDGVPVENQPGFNPRNVEGDFRKGYSEEDCRKGYRKSLEEDFRRSHHENSEKRYREFTEGDHRRRYEGSLEGSPRRRYQDSEAPTEIVEFRRIGDRARYLDNFETALVKDARLVRYDSWTSLASEISIEDDFSLLYARINQIRRKNKVPPLAVDPGLAQQAKTWAMEICFENRFRRNPDIPSNIWFGKNINPKIIDEWNDEMQNWSRHYFECFSLRKMGIAKFPQHRDFVVVAFYN